MRPRPVRIAGDASTYWLFSNRIHRTLNAQSSYLFGRAWGLVAPSQAVIDVAELVSAEELNVARSEIDAANLADAKRIGAQAPLTVQGASEAYIQDRCDNLYKTIATIVNTTSGNVIIDGRNNRDQILNRINAL